LKFLEVKSTGKNEQEGQLSVDEEDISVFDHQASFNFKKRLLCIKDY